MIDQTVYGYGTVRSCIRDLFEYGCERAKTVGRENVYDFSLGNPCVPPPPQVNAAILDIIAQEPSIAVHGYTSAPGDAAARDAIAADLNARVEGAGLGRNNIFLTCGAAAAMTSALRALAVSDSSEAVVIAPYFPEYACYAHGAGMKLRVVAADTEHFQIDFNALEAAINKNTQAVIVNSPNNPSGVVTTVETMQALAALLEKKSREAGHPIYLVSDEPYRELVYDGADLPYAPKFYPNTVICYSYSKCLSLPGERIGYALVPPEAEDSERLMAAIGGAARSFGYVCAPSLMQRMIARCAHLRPDVAAYKRRRDLIYNGLMELGYDCAKPDGAFYLFVRAPGGDAQAFSDKARKHDLLIVPGGDFGCPTHFRICYCVEESTIINSLPIFKRILE